MRWGWLLGLVLATVAHAAGPPTVVFLSDFGTRDDAVAICKGVMLQVEPALRMIDLTHEVTPFAIADAARLLADTADHYPAGTVFLAVIDPGVGGARKPMIARSKRGQFFVLPDNGLVTLVADRQGLAGAREIVNPRWMRAAARSSTFHGRDIFAPAAAHVARGLSPERLGRRVTDPVLLVWPRPRVAARRIGGAVVHVDRFGNLVTSIPGEAVASLGSSLTVRVGARSLPLVRTYGELARGRAGALVGSRNRLEIAVNAGSAAAVLGARRGTSVVVSRASRSRTRKRA
jgi:S-adenosyl-L-methionine hydrolase (adenosine-forming)